MVIDTVFGVPISIVGATVSVIGEVFGLKQQNSGIQYAI
jgi:hypothetical protein